MPLHPQVQLLLDQIAALGGPPIETLPPALARRAFEGMRLLSGAPEAVAHVADLSLPGPGGALPARLYLPAAAAADDDGAGLPVLVFFHGGGWVIGSITTHDGLCRRLARAAGCAVISVDYRLAPEHKFPAAVEDAYAATCHIAAHAAALSPGARLDPARLLVGGDSAGGNLATVATLLSRERGGPPIAGQLLLYPATAHSRDTESHRAFGSGYFLTAEAMAWFSRHYLRTEEDQRHPHVSPLLIGDLRGLPPAVVITAEYDPLRDEGEAYARRLAEAGVAVTLRRYGGMVHGFLQMAGVIDAVGEALSEIGADLRALLAQEGVLD